MSVLNTITRRCLQRMNSVYNEITTVKQTLQIYIKELKEHKIKLVI